MGSEHGAEMPGPGMALAGLGSPVPRVWEFRGRWRPGIACNPANSRGSRSRRRTPDPRSDQLVAVAGRLTGAVRGTDTVATPYRVAAAWTPFDPGLSDIGSLAPTRLQACPGVTRSGAGLTACAGSWLSLAVCRRGPRGRGCLPGGSGSVGWWRGFRRVAGWWRVARSVTGRSR